MRTNVELLTQVAATWRRALHDVGARAEDVAFDALLARYGEPHRAYHTVEHLTAVVANVETLAEECVDEAAALLAGFFHDAVYEIGAADNETASARLAVEQLTRLGGDATRVARVGALVSATADHIPLDDPMLRADARVLIDADLAILASPPAEYWRYVDAVRREYAAVPDDLWAAGRGAVLDGLLQRPAIFHTRRGADWEASARRNLQAEREALSERG